MSDHIVDANKMDTPRTDEAEANAIACGIPISMVCRQLERELNGVIVSRDEWAQMCGQYKQERDEAKDMLSSAILERDYAISYRDEAEEKLESIKRWIDRNFEDGFHSSLTYLQNLECVSGYWRGQIDALKLQIDRQREDFLMELKNMGLEKDKDHNWNSWKATSSSGEDGQ